MKQLLVLLLLALCACDSPEGGSEDGAARTTGTVAEAGERAPLPPGRWRKQREPQPALTAEQRQQIERLEAIGYAAGSRPAPDRSGVVFNDPQRAHAGINFYVSGHAPEALLVDMEGNVLHRWRREFRDSFPDRAVSEEKPDTGFWRRAVLFENGDLLAIHEGLGILKLDRDSRLLWARPYQVHHDLEVLSSGEILALTREARIDPRVSPKAPILEDFVSFLDADGNENRRISLLDCYENGSADHDWRSAARTFWHKERTRGLADNPGDIFHTNSLHLLDGRLADRSPAFARGNLLLSMCHLDTILVVDPRGEEVVWSLGGIFALQHDPTILGDGSLMLFDNNWMPGRSRVVALDPLSGETVWEYRGSEERPFHSRTCGTAEELPNGNILITESDSGRAFEVTRNGEIVWEFYNPHRAGEQGEYIATLFELQRLPPAFGRDWLKTD